MHSIESKRLVLHADQEHGGLRAAVLLGMVVILLASFLLLRAIMSAAVPSSDYIGFVSCLGALPFSLPLVWAGEQGLKRLWPSGRYISVDQNGICAVSRKEESSINWSDDISHTKWFFRLSGYQRGGHERRVPKQWKCYAYQLQQEDRRIIAYSYLSKKKADELLDETELAGFNMILPSEVYQNSIATRLSPPTRPNIPSSVLAGKDGRYWLAERRRWTEGFEITPKDFGRLLKAVRSN